MNEPGQTLLGGEYELGAVLGSGATGTVYRARSRRRGEDVAVKVLAPERVANPAALARFLDEYRQLSALSHPCLVPVYGSDRDGDRVYIAMRLATGGTLRDRLDRVGRLDPILVGRLVRQLAAALGHLHAHGLVHLDVKPANVLLVGADWPLLGDFGVARVAASEIEAAGPAGTPGYMSPEQCRNDRVDGRADQYALGVLAYELLTGRRPFVAESVEALMRAHAVSPPPRPATLNPALSAEVEAVLARALAKEPAARYESIEGFAEALAGALEALPARRVQPELGAEVERRLFLTRAASSEEEAARRVEIAAAAARGWWMAGFGVLGALVVVLLVGVAGAAGWLGGTGDGTGGALWLTGAGWPTWAGWLAAPALWLVALAVLVAAALVARAAVGSRSLGAPLRVAAVVAGRLAERAPVSASTAPPVAAGEPGEAASPKADRAAEETGDARARRHDVATLTAERVRARGAGGANGTTSEAAASGRGREPDTAEMAALSGG